MLSQLTGLAVCIHFLVLSLVYHLELPAHPLGVKLHFPYFLTLAGAPVGWNHTSSVTEVLGSLHHVAAVHPESLVLSVASAALAIISDPCDLHLPTSWQDSHDHACFHK